MMQRLNRLAWRGGLWGCFFLLCLSAFYMGAGRLLTPLLNASRVEIQDWLGSQLGQNLYLGRLHADWHGLSPRVYAEDVRLGEDGQALHIERLYFRPDMLGSLLRRTWSLSAISLQGLEVELREDETGWKLNGMRLGSAGSEEGTGWQQWLEQVQRVGRVSLVDARLQVYPLGAAPLVLQQAGLSLEQSGQDKRLQARVTLPDGQQLAVVVGIQGALSNWHKGSLDAYVSVPDSNWLQWLPPAWLQGLPAGLQLKQAGLEFQAWLQIEQGQLSSLLVDSPGGRVLGSWQSQELDIGLGRLQVGLTLSEGQRLLWLPELNVRWQPGASMQNLALLVRQSAREPWNQAATELTVGSLQLEPFMAAVLQYVPMPALAHDILTQLDFRGRMHNTRMSWTPGESWRQLEYDTNLESLEYSPWNDVPGASGISGRLFGNLAGGELHLDSDGFSLFLRELFAEPWQYHRANARLTWALADNLDFTLTSPYLQLQGDEGRLAGDFVIHLPADRERESYMDLRVGMRDGDAAYKAKYLPLVLREKQQQLWRWLNEAIRAGEIHQGYFQYQGSLRLGAVPAARSISLYFDVSDARLAYQPDWPLLEEGRARVFVHDKGVEVEIDQARVLQTGISDARAVVLYPESGSAGLQVTAQLDSSMDDALHIVQKTPLTEELALMSDWQGSGSLAGSLQLNIPFSGAHPVHVLLNVQLDNNRLRMPALDFELEQLQGNLVIDSREGLTGSAILGRFLDQPFTASLQPQPGSTGWTSQLRARGRMPVAPLQGWLKYRQPLPFAGAFNYQLELALGEESQLAITTDLQGVNIDLPAPLAKSAGDKVAASWHMTFTGAERHYRLRYGSSVDGLFAVAGDQVRGQLMLGGQPARLPAEQGLQVSGRMERLPVAEWLSVVERYHPPGGGGGGSGLRELQLEADVLEGFGIPLEQARLGVWPVPGNGWRVHLDSRQASGTIQVPPQGSLLVDLARLQLPEQVLQQTGSLAGSFAPAKLPAMQVHVRQLHLGEQLLGELVFSSSPVEGGLQLTGLAATLQGLQLKGEMDWRSMPQQRSSFQGSLAGEDLERVLRDWGYTAAISSESFTVGLDLKWPGAPQDFALSRLDGEARLKIRKGQLIALDGSAQALRAFGLLNFDAIGRRLRLDFKDLWGKGLSYDRIDALLDIEQGVFNTREPLTLEGISSNFSMNGSLDVPAGNIDASLEVAMPISRNLPLAAVAVGAPAVGGALFVIDRLVGDHFARMAAVHYQLSGDWNDPQITLSKGGGSP